MAAARSGHTLLALLGCALLLSLHAALAADIGTSQTGAQIVDPIGVFKRVTDRAAAAHRGKNPPDTASLAQQGSSNEEEQPADMLLSAETEAAVDKLLEKLKQDDADADADAAANGKVQKDASKDAPAAPAAAAPKLDKQQPKNVARDNPKAKKDTNSVANGPEAPKHVAPKIPRPGASNNNGAAGARKQDKNTNNRNAAARNLDKEVEEYADETGYDSRDYGRRNGEGRYGPNNPEADEYRGRDYEQQQHHGDSSDTPYDGPDSYARRHGSDGYEKRHGSDGYERRRSYNSRPEPDNSYARQPHRERQYDSPQDGPSYGLDSSTDYKYDEQEYDNNNSPQQPDDYESAYDKGAYAKRDRYGSPKEEGKPFPWVNGPYGDSYHYNRLPDIYKHEDLYDVYTNGGYVSLGGLDVSESSLLADLRYTGDRNCSGVLNTTETTAVVTLDLAAASPVSDDAPPVKQLDGPFGFWMAHLEKYVTLEPLPDCPFVEIEGVASRPTRIILQGRTAPTTSTDADEVTAVLSYQTSGTVPNFPIDWDELTKLTLKFNGQSRYIIEEIEVSDGSWFTLLDASFSIKIVARLRA